MLRSVSALLLSALCMGAMAQTSRENFDFNWRFAERDVEQGQLVTLDDNDWQPVNLPHDWDISHAPELSAPSGNDGGYFPGGICWYRKRFAADPSAGSVRLHFEGVYQLCQVYVNGNLAGEHHYGYTPFSLDITGFLNPSGKDNVVAVRVDNSAQPNCRWYSGSGIYRHVWLETFQQGAIDDPSRLFVRTGEIFGISADGTHADSATVRITYSDQPDETRTYRDVRLWSPSSPTLYDVQVGSLTVKHGFRTISYSSDEGFLLNGKQLLINGACVHHDDGILGAMAFDAAEIRKVRLMKEAGFNLIRTSHNPTTRAFLDACDSLGMLVIDEAFDGWRTLKTAHDYHDFFDTDYASDIAALVLRDRNHPCVIAWSIGNEVIERKEIRVIQTARKLKAAVLSHDDTRPVTEALCSWDDDWDIFDPHAEVLDIVGYNYMMHKHEGDHERCPERVMWQTESYPRDAFLNWQRTSQFPYIIGDIVWTGLDYLGESGIGQFYHPGEPDGEHYNGKHFPFHGAYCGDVDITGWRKPISHYRQLLWNRQTAPTLYLAVKEPAGYHGGVSETLWSVWPTWESWNWEGWEGKPIEAEIYTKAPAVRLYLNDELIATLQVDSTTEFKATIPLTYQPGTLRAVALDADGRETETRTLTTAGKPAASRLSPDRPTVNADGEDISFVTLEILDADGNVVPNASVPTQIAVSGEGILMSAGTANMQDLEPLTSPQVTTWQGRALIAVRTTQKPGKIQITASSPGLTTSKLTLKSVKGGVSN
ncbi:MAG: DUF4982 domain-containing protein [Prevotellaceae bacterium]|nr:DUF4982 domain-containing protein [Prevotellaceae bacterium]